jgi:hypothetical protein
LSNSFEGELSSFLESYSKGDALYKLYKDLSNYTGPLPWTLINLLASSPALRAQARKTLAAKEVRSVWQFAIEFVAMMQNDQWEKAVSKCVNVISSYQSPFTEVAIQLLAKQLLLLDESAPAFTEIPKSLLGSIFRGINVETLVDSVRGTHLAHGGYGNHEKLFGSLLKEVKIDLKKGVFTFAASDLYETALIEDPAKATIVDASIEKPQTSKVKVSEIRRWLRTNHDKERFDYWLQRKKDSPDVSDAVLGRSAE